MTAPSPARGTTADAAREVLRSVMVAGFMQPNRRAQERHAPALARFRLALDSEQAVEAMRREQDRHAEPRYSRTTGDDGTGNLYCRCGEVFPPRDLIRDWSGHSLHVARATHAAVLAHAEREAQP